MNTEDLTKCSHKIILCSCDICCKEKEMNYRTYLKHIKYDTLYYCLSCSMIKRSKICFDRYDVGSYVETDEFKDKSKLTCEKRYNSKFYQSTDVYKNGIINICLKRYGVTNVMQNIYFFNSQRRASYLLNNYKESEITYQGTYELHFLDNYYDSMNIENSMSIPYKLNENNHVYHPDFYIPEYNLIIEIKSIYL